MQDELSRVFYVLALSCCCSFVVIFLVYPISNELHAQADRAESNGACSIMTLIRAPDANWVYIWFDPSILKAEDVLESSRGYQAYLLSPTASGYNATQDNSKIQGTSPHGV